MQSAEGKGAHKLGNLGLLRVEMHVTSMSQASRLVQDFGEGALQVLHCRLFGPFLLPFRPKSKTDPLRPVLGV